MHMRAPDLDTKRGNPIVLVVLIVVSVVLTTISFKEGPSGPLHQTRIGVLAISAPVAAVGTWVTYPFRAIGDFAAGIAVSRSDVDKLRAQNKQLITEVTQLEGYRVENDRLSRLLVLKQYLKLPSVGAHVISRPTSSLEGALEIDKGSAAGLRVGMSVVATEGLVGQISEVAPNASKVQLITDRQSGVAVLIQSSRAPGILYGSIDGSLSLRFVSSKSKPKVGDVVVTSGMVSGMPSVFPGGIVVGDVTAVHSERGTDPALTVTSRGPVDAVEDVLVITGPPAGRGAGK